MLDYGYRTYDNYCGWLQWHQVEEVHMNYLVIDLEMCRVSKLCCKRYKYANETIQIGAVLLDENFTRIASLCQYVNPEYKLVEYIMPEISEGLGCTIGDLLGHLQIKIG